MFSGQLCFVNLFVVAHLFLGYLVNNFFKYSKYKFIKLFLKVVALFFLLWFSFIKTIFLFLKLP